MHSEQKLREALESLKSVVICPCCEARREPHDEECTLANDDAVAFVGIGIQWERNAKIEAALGATPTQPQGITLDPHFGDPFVWCDGSDHSDALHSDGYILIEAPKLRALIAPTADGSRARFDAIAPTQPAVGAQLHELWEHVKNVTSDCPFCDSEWPKHSMGDDCPYKLFEDALAAAPLEQTFDARVLLEPNGWLEQWLAKLEIGCYGLHPEGKCVQCDFWRDFRAKRAAYAAGQSASASLSEEQVQALARVLAIYAKQLCEGMKRRVKREPDIADYLPEFERAITVALRTQGQPAEKPPKSISVDLEDYQ